MKHKHLFEEDHDLTKEVPDDSLETIEDVISYGMDPLEILIQLQEIQTALLKAERDKKLNTAYRSTYGYDRVTGEKVVDNRPYPPVRLVRKS